MKLYGGIYCFLWYWSIVCGFLTLCCPASILILISNKAYRHAMDLIFAVWELYPVGLMEVMFGTETVVTGDRIRPWERAILVMNHRTRLDWNFLWACMHYATVPPAHRLKFILKAPIRHIPGPGWVMQMAGFFYIHRNWAQDKIILTKMLEYYKCLSHTYQILIFPEGTDLTEKSIAKSNEFANKNNLPFFSKVLHPKTTGFSFLADKMKSMGQLDAIYDLTVGYPPGAPHTEGDLLKHPFPAQVHFYINRYSVEDLRDGEEALGHWLRDLWASKESLLSEFEREGSFVPRTSNSQTVANNRPMSNSLHLAVICWTALTFCTTWLLITSTFFQCYSLVCSITFIFLSLASQGIHHIEAAVYSIRSKLITFKKSE